MTPSVRSSRRAPEPSDPITPSRPLELVDPDEWRRRRRTRIAAVIIAAVAVASPFVIVVMNVQMAQRQIELQRLHVALNGEQRKYETLRDEVLRESSPEGIAAAAQSLGLVRAPNVTVVAVPPSDTSPSAVDDGALAASNDVTRNKLADAP